MKKIRLLLRKLLQKTGYDVFNIAFADQLTKDLSFYLAGIERPMILDVGACTGGATQYYKKHFPNAVIHALEPSPAMFEYLKKNCSEFDNTHLWELAAGSTNNTMTFLENSHGNMSSFLEPSEAIWGTIIKRTEVKVTTIDCFAETHRIECIDLLKIDTQGYDIEVIKGAEGLIKAGKVRLIYFEMTFSDMYKGLPSFDAVYKYLTDLGFLFVGFYEPHEQNHLLGWTDLMFVNKEYYHKKSGH